MSKEVDFRDFTLLFPVDLEQGYITIHLKYKRLVVFQPELDSNGAPIR